jgi:hypothetical protein
VEWFTLLGVRVFEFLDPLKGGEAQAGNKSRRESEFFLNLEEANERWFPSGCGLVAKRGYCFSIL